MAGVWWSGQFFLIKVVFESSFLLFQQCVRLVFKKHDLLINMLILLGTKFRSRAYMYHHDISFVPRDGGFPGGRHGWCYAWSWWWGGGGVGMITFLALAHMVGATQHHGVGWGGDDNILCTCTHGWCYATSCSLHLHTWWCYATSCFLHLHTWSVLRNIMFLALAHMVGATQHHVLDQNSINLFRRLVGDEVCKERCDSYVLTAGDNCAESLCAVSKKQLRRTNLNIAVA